MLIYSVRVRGREGWRTMCVCAEFLGLATGTGRARDGNTVVSAHYHNSLESRLPNRWNPYKLC